MDEFNCVDCGVTNESSITNSIIVHSSSASKTKVTTEVTVNITRNDGTSTEDSVDNSHMEVDTEDPAIEIAAVCDKSISEVVNNDKHVQEDTIRKQSEDTDHANTKDLHKSDNIVNVKNTTVTRTNSKVKLKNNDSNNVNNVETINRNIYTDNGTEKSADSASTQMEVDAEVFDNIISLLGDAMQNEKGSELVNNKILQSVVENSGKDTEITAIFEDNASNTDVSSSSNGQVDIINQNNPTDNTSNDHPSTNATTPKENKVELFTKVEGPSFYNVTGKIVTDPIITKNLPKVFESLPVFGKPSLNDDLQQFHDAKLKAYMGSDIGDEEFEELAKYCSPDHLRTGKELTMSTSHPVQWVMSSHWKDKLMKESLVDLKKINLQTIKRSISNCDREMVTFTAKKLKYRSIRLYPTKQQSTFTEEPDLEPGKEIVFHIRLYKPFLYNSVQDSTKRKFYPHSLFVCNLIMVGSQTLATLRDMIVCSNDMEMRVDVSNSPDNLPEPTARDVFPSGFLFINNVFYVDTREGCVDHSAPIREWAHARKLGHFQHKDMCATRLDEIVLRLGYPEVYVHQGDCEHIFIFSEIRLLNSSDPLFLNQYPYHTQASLNQVLNCNTCAEFSAKWLVTNCERVPFDPALFCDTCFRQYLYKDGVKIGEFKAYRYRGNELNVLKPG